MDIDNQRDYWDSVALTKEFSTKLDKELIVGFEEIEYNEITHKTMNGNISNGFNNKGRLIKE